MVADHGNSFNSNDEHFSPELDYLEKGMSIDEAGGEHMDGMSRYLRDDKGVIWRNGLVWHDPNIIDDLAMSKQSSDGLDGDSWWWDERVWDRPYTSQQNDTGNRENIDDGFNRIAVEKDRDHDGNSVDECIQPWCDCLMIIIVLVIVFMCIRLAFDLIGAMHDESILNNATNIHNSTPNVVSMF